MAGLGARHAAGAAGRNDITLPWIQTNPDMLHRSMLPAHGRWAYYSRPLRYVVVDECHSYRGLFGSHVAQILRRPWRSCASYGSAPIFVLAAATGPRSRPAAGRAAGHGSECRRLAARGDDVRPMGAAADGAAGENNAPVRRAAGADAARLLADLVIEGARTLTFVRSRRGTDLAARGAAGLGPADMPGAAHPAEPAVFVCDGHAGGARFAERGHSTIVDGSGAPAWRSHRASASPAARRACSRPGAATATNRSTRARCCCSTSCSPFCLPTECGAVYRPSPARTPLTAPAMPH
jgi:hypothetical protein